MIKLINYFFQAIIIYLFFLIGRILGLNISRKIFSTLFLLIGPLFKSKDIMKKNLNIFSSSVKEINEKNISDAMWKNYGMTFIEYAFLNQFKKKNSHMIIKGEDNLRLVEKNAKPVIFISGHIANFELM